MGSLETSGLNQLAVLWPKAPTSADAYGRIKVGSLVEINCRWEWRVDLQQAATNDNRQVIAVVHVDQVIEVGSIIWKGAEVDLPSNLTDLCEVVGYEEVPDVKGREVQRTITVSSYHGQLPAGA